MPTPKEVAEYESNKRRRKFRKRLRALASSGGGSGGITIEGTGQTGTYLWANGVAPFQWMQDGVDVGGETNQNYLLTTADEGKIVTYRDANGLVSSGITGTWVRQTFTRPFDLDMDAENARYSFGGALYTEPEFEGFSWAPDVINGNLLNKLFSTGSAPYPGFDPSVFSTISISSLTDNAADPGVTDFGNNGTQQWASSQHRWSVNTSRQAVVVGGVTQVATTSTGTLISGTRYTTVSKFKLHEFAYRDPVTGRLFKDNAGTMPTPITQMRTGAIQNGINVGAGVIERVSVCSGDTPLLEIEHAALGKVLTIDYSVDLALNDGIDALDIFNDGYPAIINGNQNGKIFLWRQRSRGRFTRTAIKNTAIGSAKVEGVCFIDSRGDGFYQVAQCDQDLSVVRLYEPTIRGDYGQQTDWSMTTIVTGKVKLQDVKAIRASGDDRDTLWFTWEASTNNAGGVGKTRWNGSAFIETTYPRDGAWGIAQDLFSDGKLLVTARNTITGGNPQAEPGVFQIAQDGTITPISAVANDWLRPTIGDFFGLGNEDAAATYFDGTTVAFVLFDSASAWAATSVNHVAGTIPELNRNYGLHNLHYQANGRDALLVLGEGRASVWHWDGVSAWVVAQQWTDVVVGMKADDNIARMNITRRLKPDIVFSNSNGNSLIVLALTT